MRRIAYCGLPSRVPTRWRCGSTNCFATNTAAGEPRAAGYPQAGGENDTATNQALMNVLRALAQMMNCFVLAIDHYGKNIEAGTRGASSKEASADLVLACLGTKSLSGPSTTPGWLRAKIAAGSKVSSTPSA